MLTPAMSSQGQWAFRQLKTVQHMQSTYTASSVILETDAVFEFHGMTLASLC